MDYHSDRFSDHSLIISKESETVALLPANINDGILYSHQGLTYGSLILSAKTKFRDTLQIFKQLLKYLSDEGINELYLKQLPRIYCKSPSDELNYLAFKLNATLTRVDILSVVQPKKIQLSRDRINGVKRGEKSGLKVKEVDDLEDFWNSILVPNLNTKHGVPPVHSLNEIKLLKSRFPKQIRQFNVYQGDTIVAGTTIFETDLVAHSQYISANSDKNTLGSLDLLHHYLLTEVFKDKPYFDFGISNENQGKNVNEGLLYWKEGFGARAVVHQFFKIESKNHHLLDDLMI